MSVALLDGRSVELRLDSASTSAEVCQALADNINLQDTYGFSLYISLFDKVSAHTDSYRLQTWLILSVRLESYQEPPAVSLADVVSGQLWEPRAGCGLSV